MAHDKTLMKFPCQFPIKVVGNNVPELVIEVLSIINTQFPEITEAHFSTRNSKDAKYLAITVTVTAINQQQLDDVYRSLSSNEKVIMAL